MGRGDIDPIKYGWKIANGSYILNTGYSKVCPDVILKLAHCKCKSKTPCSSRSCGCRSAGLTCTDVCECSGECGNSQLGEEDELVHADVADQHANIYQGDAQVEPEESGDIDFYDL